MPSGFSRRSTSGRGSGLLLSSAAGATVTRERSCATPILREGRCVKSSRSCVSLRPGDQDTTERPSRESRTDGHPSSERSGDSRRRSPSRRTAPPPRGVLELRHVIRHCQALLSVLQSDGSVDGAGQQLQIFRDGSADGRLKRDLELAHARIASERQHRHPVGQDYFIIVLVE